MKSILTTIIFAILFSCAASAQFELKSNPIALIFGVPTIAAEYGIRDNIGIELYGVVFPEEAAGIAFLSGKYYFNPREGLDRFNVGVFLGAGPGAFGGGFQIGQKIVAKKGLIFEFGIGAGRGIENSPFIPYLRLDLGYRFKKKK